MGPETGRIVAAGIGALAAAPTSVLAATGATVDPLNVAVSAVGLAVAVFLLFEALRVRKLATGGAIGERISLVVLATICLATSALLEWVWIFVPAGLTANQAALAARLLVIAAMGLLAAYFYSVRAAMQRFLDSMTGSEMLDALDPEPGATEAGEGDGPNVGGSAGSDALESGAELDRGAESPSDTRSDVDDAAAEADPTRG